MGKEENLESNTAEELATLRAENELLRDQLEAQQTKGPVWRRILAGALAVLTFFVVIAAVEAVWLKTTLQDEDRFVATLQSLPQDEAVATALSTRVASDVVEEAEVNAFVSEVLPDELRFLAAPLANAIEDLITRLANEVITSDAVTSAWSATLRVTHKGVSAVLSGNDRALETGDGKVVINLNEVGAVVLDRVAAVGLDLPDFDVSLGEIVLYENEDLAATQAVAKGINTIGWLLPVLALLLIAGTIWAAPTRQRMTPNPQLRYSTGPAAQPGCPPLRPLRDPQRNRRRDRARSGSLGMGHPFRSLDPIDVGAVAARSRHRPNRLDIPNARCQKRFCRGVSRRTHGVSLRMEAHDPGGGRGPRTPFRSLRSSAEWTARDNHRGCSNDDCRPGGAAG